jgi:hypothetical protein
VRGLFRAKQQKPATRMHAIPRVRMRGARLLLPPYALIVGTWTTSRLNLTENALRFHYEEQLVNFV